MQTGSPTSSDRPPSNEIELVIDVRVEPRDGGSALVVVKQRVRLESARIAPVGQPTATVRPL
jgi:hypothetical protein